MTTINILTPKTEATTIDEFAQRLATLKSGGLSSPYAPELINFTSAFSQKLLQDKEAQAYPELQSLGFWLRAASLEKMRGDFIAPIETLAVPQGIVFHIPPSNVDTIFAYSLFISLLCGNINVVRLSSQRGPAAELLIKTISGLLADAPDTLRSRLLLISYEHNNAITEALSKACDLRIIWGSNETVNALRAIPLAPTARELIFPNRFSWSAIDTTAYRSLDDGKKQKLAEHYANDLFWFDQNGCSSPRMIIWRGSQDKKSADDFYSLVAAVAKSKQWELGIGSSVQKQTRNYEAMIDLEIKAQQNFSDQLSVYEITNLEGLATMRDAPCFGGTLFSMNIQNLSELTPHVTRSDQTLASFGFTKDELKAFAQTLQGRGFDRMVPIGDALTFDTIWDGYNLPRAFTRLVRIKE